MMIALGLRLGGWRPPVPATPPSGVGLMAIGSTFEIA